jgi:hypothetical protein
MHTIRLDNVLIEVWPETKTLRHSFPDGKQLVACPQDTDGYRATAKALGYDADLWRLCLDHELLHHFVAEYAGLPYSQSLYEAATNSNFGPLHWREEELVMNLQRAMHQLPADKVEWEGVTLEPVLILQADIFLQQHTSLLLQPTS